MITMQVGRRHKRIIEIVAQSMDIWNPSMSVAVPTYNSARTPGDCLESIKNQDYQDETEVIIEDGSPSDSIFEIARDFEEK
jgi:glycosyltransferase involved in cell wall biosynthesis